jgi:hypothetical protein
MAGPNLSWLCTISCDRMPVSRDCQHEEPAASLTAVTMDNCCDSAVPGVVGFVPKDVRHTGTLLDSDHSNPALLSAFSQSQTGGRHGTGQSPPAGAQDKQALSSALRL